MEKCKLTRKTQENVYDLDLFVKVHLLEDTPAVLSLGKLFVKNTDIPVSGPAVTSHT